MLNVKAVGVSVKLVKTLLGDDDFVHVTGHSQLIVPDGDYFYAQITQGNQIERVKVIAVLASGSYYRLHVERGVDQTTAKKFNVGACVSVEWTPSQLCEYVKDCLGNGSSSIIAAGKYCLGCDTCIDINEAGNITNVYGAKKKC